MSADLTKYRNITYESKVTKEIIIRKLNNEYTKYLDEEDLLAFESAVRSNYIRPALAGVFGVFLVILTRHNTVFKHTDKYRRFFMRGGIAFAPVLASLYTLPTPKYKRMGELMYIKYYKQVAEDIVKPKKK